MIDLGRIEDAAEALRYAVNKMKPACFLEVTCASGAAGSASSYFRYVALTQRIVSNNDVIGYVCYRTKQPDKSKRVVFSSYEIFNVDFKTTSGIKIHIDPANPKASFTAALEAVLAKLKQEVFYA